jgi:hypothetical protein
MYSWQSNQNNAYVEENSEDIWYGPGYYYGIWFDDEDDYQGWRYQHSDYPPNRDYYSHDHPIEYSPDNGRNDRGGDNRGYRGDDRGGRGGGGRR